MLTKQLQTLIDVSLAGGQSYEEIRSMLSLQKFSEQDITQIFQEYDGQVQGQAPQAASFTPPAPETRQASQTRTTPVGIPETPFKVPQTQVAQSTPQTAPKIILDDGDDISFPDEEAQEIEEYNLKTPTFLDKKEYEENVDNASLVSNTIRKTVDQEVFDIDNDVEDVDASAFIQTSATDTPSVSLSQEQAQPVQSQPAINNQVDVSVKHIPDDFLPPETPQVKSPLEQVPAQSRPSAPVGNLDKSTQFGSTLTSSSVGLDFTGSQGAQTTLVDTPQAPAPQTGWYDPQMQQQAQSQSQVSQANAVPPVGYVPHNRQQYQEQQTAPAGAVVTPQNDPLQYDRMQQRQQVQQAPQTTAVPQPISAMPPVGAVNIGLGSVPELSEAQAFAGQQEKGKSIAPLIFILVIVLAIIGGFVFWYYFISDFSPSSSDVLEADTTEEVPIENTSQQPPTEFDPFTGEAV